jgi:hypothetical protein
MRRPYNRLAMLAMFAGCRCGEPERANKSVAPTPRTLAQCEYLPEDDASRILGVAVRYRGKDPLDPEAPACELASDDGVRLVVQVSADTAAYDFATANGWTPVANLGDGAAWRADAQRMVAIVRGRDAGVTLQAAAGRLDTRAKAAELLAVVLARM